MMRKILVFFCLLSAFTSGFAQKSDAQIILKRRMNQIHRFHAGFGIEGAANTNATYGIRTYIGFGSSRHLFNADFGLGLRIWNFVPGRSEDYYRILQIPMFASLIINPIRWSEGCLQVGCEGILHFGVRNFTHTVIPDYESHDFNAIRTYASIRSKIGVMLGHLNLGVFYEHDLSPLSDQKYIYESGLYNFDGLRPSLYEHNRIGISFSYSFIL